MSEKSFKEATSALSLSQSLVDRLNKPKEEPVESEEENKETI